MNNYLTPEIMKAIRDNEKIIVFLGSTKGVEALKKFCLGLGIKWPFGSSSTFNTRQHNPKTMQGIRFNLKRLTHGRISNAYSPDKYKVYIRYETK